MQGTGNLKDKLFFFFNDLSMTAGTVTETEQRQISSTILQVTLQICKGFLSIFIQMYSALMTYCFALQLEPILAPKMPNLQAGHISTDDFTWFKCIFKICRFLL